MLNKLNNYNKKNIIYYLLLVKMYNLYLIFNYLLYKLKNNHSNMLHKILFFIHKKCRTQKKKLRKKNLYLKKKKIRRKKQFSVPSNVLLLKKFKYTRLFNGIVKQEVVISKSKDSFFYDVRGKFSMNDNYSWCSNYVSAKYLLLLKLRNIFKKKGYFKTKKITNNIKKKSNYHNVLSYNYSISWFNKWKLLHTITNHIFVSSDNIIMFDNNILYSMYYKKKTYLNKQLNKELYEYNLDINQLDSPNRFFKKQVNTHSIWK